MEHMAFKGTTRRPTPREVARELDTWGAEFNAFTGREWLAFYVRSGPEHTSRAIDVLIDMYTDSIFTDESIRHEIDVVTEELRLTADDWRQQADDLMHRTMFHGTGLARPVGGDPTALRNIRHNDLAEFARHNFIASNTVLGIAGEITQRDLDYALDQLEAIPSPDSTHQAPPGEFRTRPAPLAIVESSAPQVHLVYSVPGWEATNANRYQAGLLHTVLGGGMLAALFTKLREEQPLTYYVGADHATYRDAGSFNLRAGTRPDNVPKVLDLMHTELQRVRMDGPTEAELSRAISYATGRLQLGVSDPRGMLLFLMRRACTDGYWEHPEAAVQAMRSTSWAEIREFATTLSTAYTVSAVGADAITAQDWAPSWRSRLSTRQSGTA